jgi:hypothetical protein
VDLKMRTDEGYMILEQVGMYDVDIDVVKSGGVDGIGYGDGDYGYVDGD